MVTKKEMLMLQERTRQKILSEPKYLVDRPKQLTLGERLNKSYSRHQIKSKKGVFE